MDHEVDDSYVVIVNNSDEESGIKVYNFDDGIKPDIKENIITECEKLLKNTKGIQTDYLSKLEIKKDKKDELLLDVKDEPLDYDEYLNSDDEYLISNDELTNDSDMYSNIKVKRKQRSVDKCTELHIKSSELLELSEDSKELVDKYVKLLHEQAKKPPPPLPDEPYQKIGLKYVCKYCEKENEKEYLAIRHYRYIHGEKYHRCFACNRGFRRPDAMIVHESYCQAENIHLVRLAREMIGQRRKEFPSKLKNKLKNKLKRKIKEPCIQCGMLITRHNMKTHVEKHTLGRNGTRRKFQCAECPASYVSARSLDAHMNKHAGIKPYQCAECGKLFANKNNLLTHKWMHMKKLFQCDYCNHTYHVRKFLIKHIKEIHGAQVGKFNCIDCKSRFKTMKYLNTHMKKCHGKQVYTREKFLELLPQMENLSGLEFDLVNKIKIEYLPDQEEEQNYHDN